MRALRGLAWVGAVSGVAMACANLSGLTSGAGGNAGDGGPNDGPSVSTDGAADAAGPDDAGSSACPDALAADPHNCGACGHDCLGGACSSGRCQPVLLASGEADPASIAVDDAGIYWADFGTSTTIPVGYADGRIVRAGKDGSGATILTGNDGTQPGGRGVKTDGTYVYWLNENSPAEVWRIQNTGGSPQTLANGDNVQYDLALDPAAHLVFWTQWQNTAGPTGDVFSTGTTPGSAVTALTTLTDGEPIALAIDSTYVYYTTVGDIDAGVDGIHRIPRAGCPGASECATLVADACYAVTVAADGTNVYFTDSCNPGTVTEVPADGGTPGSLGTTGGDFGGLALDDLWVYWTDWNDTTNVGTVWRARKDYSRNEQLAAGQNHPAGIAVDGTAVYWVNQGTDTGSDNFDNHDGQVMRLALPPGN